MAVTFDVDGIWVVGLDVNVVGVEAIFLVDDCPEVVALVRAEIDAVVGGLIVSGVVTAVFPRVDLLVDIEVIRVVLFATEVVSKVVTERVAAVVAWDVFEFVDWFANELIGWLVNTNFAVVVAWVVLEFVDLFVVVLIGWLVNTNFDEIVNWVVFGLVDWVVSEVDAEIEAADVVELVSWVEDEFLAWVVVGISLIDFVKIAKLFDRREYNNCWGSTNYNCNRDDFITTISSTLLKYCN